MAGGGGGGEKCEGTSYNPGNKIGGGNSDTKYGEHEKNQTQEEMWGDKGYFLINHIHHYFFLQYFINI